MYFNDSNDAVSVVNINESFLQFRKLNCSLSDLYFRKSFPFCFDNNKSSDHSLTAKKAGEYLDEKKNKGQSADVASNEEDIA